LGLSQAGVEVTEVAGPAGDAERSRLGDAVADVPRQSDCFVRKIEAGRVVAELHGHGGAEQGARPSAWGCPVESERHAPELLLLAEVAADDPVPEEGADEAAGAVGVSLGVRPVEGGAD